MHTAGECLHPGPGLIPPSVRRRGCAWRQHWPRRAKKWAPGPRIWCPPPNQLMRGRWLQKQQSARFARPISSHHYCSPRRSTRHRGLRHRRDDRNSGPGAEEVPRPAPIAAAAAADTLREHPSESGGGTPRGHGTAKMVPGLAAAGSERGSSGRRNGSGPTRRRKLRRDRGRRKRPPISHKSRLHGRLPQPCKTSGAA